MNIRTVKILNLLLSKEGYVEINRLAGMFGVTDRAIRYSITELNDFLLEQSLPLLQMHRKKGISISLTQQQISKVSSLFTFEEEETYISNNERHFLIIFMLISEEKKLDVKSIMTYFSISKSTVMKDMREVEIYIKKYSLFVESEGKDGYRILGGEANKRLLLLEIILQNLNVEHLFEGDNAAVLSKSEEFAQRMIGKTALRSISKQFKRLNTTIGNVYSESILRQFSIVTALMKKRISNQKVIIKKYKNLISETRISKHFFADTVTQIIPEITFFDNERRFLLQVIASINISSESHVDFSGEWVATQLNMMEIVNSMIELTGVDFLADENFLDSLYRHIEAMVSRLKGNISVYNPLTSMVKIKYRDIYDEVKISVKTLEERYGKLLSDNELAFLAIYFRSALENKKMKRYRVAIVCGQGVATGKLLGSNLKKFFDFEIIGIFASYEVQTISKMEIDFIISTVAISGTVPVILVSPFLEKKDVQAIDIFLEQNTLVLESESLQHFETNFYKKIVLMAERFVEDSEIQNFSDDLEKIFREFGYKIEKGKGAFQPMLNEIVTVEDIQVQKKVSNWEEAIRLSAEPLIQSEKIEQRYVQAMIDSVYKLGPYMVIDKYVALAHARPEDGTKEIGISFLTLKDGVVFGTENDPVKLIICLSAIDSVSHLKILSNLADIINNRNLLEKLLQSKTAEEFLTLLEMTDSP